jgi:hypothetical protein
VIGVGANVASTDHQVGKVLSAPMVVSASSTPGVMTKANYPCDVIRRRGV